MDFTKIKQYPAQISNVVKRFPLSLGFGAVASIYAMIMARLADDIDFVREHPRLFIWIWAFVILSIFLTNATKLLQESLNLSPKKGWIITGACEVVLAVLTAGYTATGDPENEHFIAKVVVLTAIVVLSPLMAPFFKGKNDLPLWNFIGKIVRSFLISTVVTLLFYGALAGLAFCAHLLTGFDFFDGKYYFDTGVFCLCIVFPTLFFAGFPDLREPNENSETSKYFNNTIHFLFIPVLLLYILFVYAYSLKIALGAPHDLLDISALALTAVVSTIVISGIIYPGHFKSGFDNKFLKIVPGLAIPLALLSMGKFTHVLDVATPDDDYVLLYILLTHTWLIIALIILLIPRIKKKIWWTLASLIIVALISTFSPVNVFKISAHTYLTSEKRIEREVERLQEREKQLEELAAKEARTKTYAFDNDDYSPITIPANRRTMEKLNNSYLRYTQVSLAGDTIFIQVKTNRIDDDSTFMHFAVPVSLLSSEDDDKDDAEAIADAVPVKKEKPMHLVLDNGSETLVLTEAYFKFIEGEEDENYGSLRGYIFK